MAYNILPSTEEEARKAVGFMNETSAKEAFRLYRHLYKKYGHIIPNPLAFDSSKKNDCKIARMIQTEFTIKDIKKQDYLKLNYNKFLNKYNNIHIIGNPPFGKQSSLAKKFI